MSTVFDIVQSLPEDKRNALQTEYEALCKRSVADGFNIPNPEQWLSERTEIASIKVNTVAEEQAYRQELLLKFKSIMIPAGFGSLLERSMYLYLGK